MTRIAYLVTSAREMTLADGTAHPTGYFAEEALKPYERFTDAGFDVTVITPDGNPPSADPYGLSWFFHYPDEDKDYLASVVRTFAHDVDDIRLTLHQNTELGLAAARRVAALLQQQGRTPAEAHRIVTGRWWTWPTTPTRAACSRRCTPGARPSPHCATARPSCSRRPSGPMACGYSTGTG